MSMPPANRAALRALPGIDRLLGLPEAGSLISHYGHDLTVNALRAALDQTREALLQGHESSPGDIPPDGAIIAAAQAWLDAMLISSLRPVINATGVIIHTNLGRAPLCESAMANMAAVAAGYSTLEYDLAAGRRGSRTTHPESPLKQLTGAEAALVVNNNAAAVLLMLAALCRDRDVLISRGQLVEIGGGFRVPDVMAQSGARLVEVGTTNRTHLDDYAAAIGPDTAAILVVHPSNYKIIGYAGEPEMAELAALARERGLWLLYDQGSGALRDVTRFGLAPEPTVQDGLAAGADVVTFSGDKLLGGPQAGVLVGRARLIDHIRRHPLARAVRADKLALAALTATLAHYLTGRETEEIPVWRMIARPLDEIAAEAEAWAAQLRGAGVDATTAPDASFVGGGSLPGESLPTRVVAIGTDDAGGLAARLRSQPLPVIARIHDGRVLLDPRTVLPVQVEPLLESVASCAGKENSLAD